jgi:hypothetical protein
LDNLILKVRISVLWIFMAVALSAHSALFLMVPGAAEEVEAMAMGPEMLFFMSLFWWVPLVMAFLSVTLKDVANRMANLIVGAIFTIVNIMHFIEHLAQPSAHTILLVGSTVAVTALVVWYAWKWPRQEV